ncbi:MAG: hypothetical protein ACKOA0_15025 [Burkholderiaceae bacterium]
MGKAMPAAQTTCAEQNVFTLFWQDLRFFIKLPGITGEAERITRTDMQGLSPKSRIGSDILCGINTDFFVFFTLICDCLPDQASRCIRFLANCIDIFQGITQIGWHIIFGNNAFIDQCTGDCANRVFYFFS